VNLVSAAVAAIGVSLVFTFMMMLLDRWLPALVSVATLGLGGQWWAHASVATPYNSVPTIICAFLILLLLWQRHGNIKVIWSGALLAGFGLSYHPSLLYFIPVLLAGFFILGPWREALRLKPLAVTFALLALGLSIYLYLPIRSAMDPIVRYTQIDSLSSLYHFVTVSEARSTGTFATRIPDQEQLGQRLAEVVRQGYFPSYAILVFAPAVTLLYPAVLRALRPNRRLLLFLLLGALAHMTVVFIISGIYVQYYLPVLLYFSIWAGFSVFLIMTVADIYLEDRRLKRWPAVVTGAIYFIVLALGLPGIWPYVNHHDDRGMRAFDDWVFSQAKPGAAILANWDAYPGLFYAQKVDGQRPDITLVPVPPETWRDYLPDIKSLDPSQILLARSLPFKDTGGTQSIGPYFFVSVKGRTYQDQSRGLPYPASVQLYEVQQP
jgi:4-amino-4-deoxy-L-arabinose transferase-like glycosyltransferase